MTNNNNCRRIGVGISSCCRLSAVIPLLLALTCALGGCGGDGTQEGMLAQPSAEAPDSESPAPSQPEQPASAPVPAVGAAEEAEALAQLEAQLASFKVPPDWLSSVTTTWDVTGKPWQEARIEIRRLLGLNEEAARREAVKLTWDYLQKNDIGDGHEYGMYTFLGNEPLWAIIAFREHLAKPDHAYPPYFDIQALASLYAQHGVFPEAERVLQRGLAWPPPDEGWAEMRAAEMHDALGDLYVAWGKLDEAKAHYLESIRLYPLANPKYGKHLLPRRAEKVQSKLDVLSVASLEGVALRDGKYVDTALGYAGDIKITVTVASGRIADIALEHQEKIDQNACKLIPQRIIEAQSLKVDGISGATVTYDAIVGGTLRALRQAGLE